MPISAATNPAYNPPGTTKRNQSRYTWVFGYRFTDTEYETFSNFTSLPNLYTAWCMWIDWQVGIEAQYIGIAAYFIFTTVMMQIGVRRAARLL